MCVKNNYKKWTIPIHKYTKDGQIHYTTRFFIPETNTIEESVDDIRDYKETLTYQQHISLCTLFRSVFAQVM